MSANSELGQKFAEAHPADAARVLERATPEEAAGFLEEISIAAATDVVRHMNVAFAAACLSAAELGAATRIIEGLPLDRATQILRHSGPRAIETLLESVSDRVAQPLRRALRYPQGTAGALADPQVLSLPSDMSIGDAHKQLRRPANQAAYNVYVTDREHRLTGVVTIRQLLLTKPKQTLESIMQRQVIRLAASSDLASVAAHPAWHEFDMLPVVDKAGVLLGAIRHKTLRQHTAAGADARAAVNILGVALRIADMYWITVSGLAAGVAATTAAQRNAGPNRGGR